jgi:hypothetical protein
MRRWLPLLVFVGGCGGAAAGVLEPDLTGAGAEPVTAGAVVDPDLVAVHPGESMRFEVRMAGVLAGDATFTAGEPGEQGGRRAIALSSRVGTAGAFALVKDIRDDATSVLDLDTLLPVSTTSDVRFGGKVIHTEAHFGDGKVAIDYTPHGQGTRRLTYDLRGETVHDFHSAMAVMRIWPAELGTRRVVWALGGRRLWRAEIEVVGRDVIRKPRSFTIWVSDDADRVPLRVVAHTELGDVTIDLIEYQRP